MNLLKTLFLAGASAATFSSCKEMQEIAVEKASARFNPEENRALVEFITTSSSLMTYEMLPLDQQNNSDAMLVIHPYTKDTVSPSLYMKKENVIQKLDFHDNIKTIQFNLRAEMALDKLEYTTGKEMSRRSDFDRESYSLIIPVKRIAPNPGL